MLYVYLSIYCIHMYVYTHLKNVFIWSFTFTKCKWHGQLCTTTQLKKEYHQFCSSDTPMCVTSTPDMMPLNKLEKGPL